MKTNSRRASGRARLYAIGLAALACLVVLVFARGPVGGAVAQITSPIVGLRAWVSDSHVASFFRSQAALSAEIEGLEGKLRAHAGDALTIRRLEDENAALAALLGFSEDERIASRVLIAPGDTPYDTFLVDRGSEDGVKEGAVVYADGIAVGTVASVYGESALVRLVSSPGVLSTAYVFGPDVFVKAEGMGGGALRISVLQDVPLQRGDVVMVPGSGTAAYGEVVEVEASDSSPFQYGYVTSPIPLSSVRFVEIAREVAPSISYEEALQRVEGLKQQMFSVPIPEEVATSTEER